MNVENAISVLKIADVIPTPDNPRSAVKNDPQIQELAESIKNSGLLCPVICRPHPTQKGKYDLRAGYRRFLAHQVLEAATIQAIVRPMDDKTALEVTILENLQRENLSPIEEARAVEALLNSGHDVKSVSAEIGKSPQWVIRRAKLLNLSPKWLKAIGNPNDQNCGCPAAKLELIARYDHQIQNGVMDEGWVMRESMAEFKKYLFDFTRRLKSAPWKLDNEALVPKIGACSKCKNRSSVHPGLFDDELDPEKISANDKCMDKNCWMLKAQAFVAMKEAELRKLHPGLMRVATEYMSYDQKEEFKDVLGVHKYATAKKGSPGAVPAVVVFGNGEGSLIWIKPTKSFDDRSGKRKTGADGKVKPLSMDQKKEHLRKRRVAWVLAHLIGLVDKTKVAPTLNAEHYLALAAVFGTTGQWGCRDKWKVANALQLGKLPPILDQAWDGLKKSVITSLIVRTVNEIDKKDEVAGLNVAVILGKDYVTLLEAAAKEIPVPKAWAKDEKKKK